MTPESILALHNLDPDDAFNEWNLYYAHMHRNANISSESIQNRYNFWIYSPKLRKKYTRLSLSARILKRRPTARRLDWLLNAKNKPTDL